MAATAGEWARTAIIQQDANVFAQWGFDAVKLDFCGAGQQGLDPRVEYEQFAAALAGNASHRPMLLNVCNFWRPGQIDGTNPSLASSAYENYQWAPQLSQSWRTDTDIGFPGNVVFANVLRNLDTDALHPEAAGPGHWNDPDYLGPELGMTSTEAESQFSMWAMLSAPLVLGSDPRALSTASISMLENAQVVAVDQDPLGAQATLLSHSGSGQVWRKRLAGGARVVALFNRGTSTVWISTTARAVGLPRASRYFIQDLWTKQTRTTRSIIAALVPAHGVVLYYTTVDKLPPKRPKPRSKRKKRPPRRRAISSPTGSHPAARPRS